MGLLNIFDRIDVLHLDNIEIPNEIEAAVENLRFMQTERYAREFIELIKGELEKYNFKKRLKIFGCDQQMICYKKEGDTRQVILKQKYPIIENWGYFIGKDDMTVSGAISAATSPQIFLRDKIENIFDEGEKLSERIPFYISIGKDNTILHPSPFLESTKP